MFNVEFWSFTKAPNSTAQPTGTSTVFKCVSNEDFNIIEPRIPLQLGPANNPTTYNYAKITVFSRYYWVTRWAFEGGLWVAYMRVDALASWKTDIGNMSAYVLRSAAAWDGALVDNMWPQLTTVAGYDQDYHTSPWSENKTGGSYVVGIAGSGATTYYWFTYYMLDVFLKYLYTNDYANNALSELAITLNPELKAQLNPLQYVTSIIWLPYSITSVNNITPQAAAHLYVGYVDVIGKTYTDPGGTTATVSAYELTTLINVSTFTKYWSIKKHPNAASYGEWASTSLAEISVCIPPFGNISLDPMQLANNAYLTAIVTVDARTGYAVLNIWAGSDTSGGNSSQFRKLLSRVTGQVGMPFQVGAVMAPGTGMAALLPSIISGVSAVAAGISTGGAAGVAVGAAGIAAAGASAIGTIAQNKIPHPNTIGGTPSVAALLGYWEMYYTWYDIADMDVAEKGRPLCEIRQLSTLSGYQLCADVEVEIPCTRDEEQMIKGFLESGYFYE